MKIKNPFKKKENKDKKKKLPLGRSLSNIGFALGEVWRSSHTYFIVYYFITVGYALLDFFRGSYLIRMIVNGVEKGTPVKTILTYMLVLVTLDISLDIFSSFCGNFVNPIQYRKIGANMQKKLFKKASEVELACYETPSFFDNSSPAQTYAY